MAVERLEFPGERETTHKVSMLEELTYLLQRIESLENLKANLETNVQEQLALEVAFLKAFA